MTIWQNIKSFLADWLAPKTTSTTPATTTLSVGITSDIGAVANGIGEVAKTTAIVISTENSPQMIQGRLNAEEQKIKDQNAKAVDSGLKSGDLSDIEKRLS